MSLMKMRTTPAPAEDAQELQAGSWVSGQASLPPEHRTPPPPPAAPA